MERMARIELATELWQSSVLPLAPHPRKNIYGGDRGNRTLLGMVAASDHRSPLLSPLSGIPGGTRTPTNSFGDCHAAITLPRYNLVSHVGLEPTKSPPQTEWYSR